VTLTDVESDVLAWIAAIPAVVSAGLTPVLDRVPEFKREEIADAELVLTPNRRTLTMFNRRQRRTAATLYLGYMEPLTLGSEDTQSVDALNLFDDIIDATLGSRIGGTTNAICTQIDQTTITSPEHWRELRQITGLMEMTFEF
jgi:hypothetical protein